MEVQQKIKILNGIAGCVPENGSAEDEEKEMLLQNFMPMRSYGKLADPKVFLITGGRGAGKTELFRILTSCDGLEHVLSERDKKRYSHNWKSEFLIGYIATGAEAKKFPAASVCTELLQRESPEKLISFWGGLVCSVILRRFSRNKDINELADRYFGVELRRYMQEGASELSKWWSRFSSEPEKWENFLDRTDNLLAQETDCLFLTYDELDRICINYQDLFAYIRGLLDFWYRHNSRFTNIKAKIFLRSDLYNANALQFVDASKMGAYQLRLNWTTLSLYRMLVKRLANAQILELRQYLEEIPGLLRKEASGALGYLPGDEDEAFRRLIDKMIGRYMGKNPKKGASYAWVPNHIQDANGEMAPRSFLKCFAFAAEAMCGHTEEMQELAEDRIMSPARLQGALEHVSEDRVKELTREEYPWLRNLISRLRGKMMLMEENEFLKYLQPGLWSAKEQRQLPGQTETEILDALLLLGIVMRTVDGRINVPEIYLHGFGLKRKGGIKRPRQQE